MPPPPTNVVVVRFDSTTIGVSWTKFTLVELKGLANYIVTYDIVIGSRKRQLGGMITLPWTQSQVIISDLQPGAEYDIAVRTSTTAGTSGIISIHCLYQNAPVCTYTSLIPNLVSTLTSHITHCYINCATQTLIN